ncbi:MAG: hypothetical protein AAGA93_09650 [Actinomycetota bacterium]
MELPLFEEVGEAVRSMAPDEVGTVRFRANRRGVKVWCIPPGGDDGPGAKAPREHYEAQVLGRRHVDGTDGVALEIGYHAEHRDPARNAAAVETIASTETTWRAILGDEAEAGEFFAMPDWRRVSEVWLEPDLDDPELPVEVASRLVDYLEAIEPARRG